MSAEFIAILSVGATLLGVIAAFGALILASINRSEARLNRRIDDVIADTRAEFAASEARFNARFEEMQVRADKGFDDVTEELRVTNNRMASIEQRQARLEGLLDGLREALFQRVQQ